MFYMGSRPLGHQLDSWHGPLEAKLLAFGPGETFQAALGEARKFGLNRGLPGKMFGFAGNLMEINSEC